MPKEDQGYSEYVLQARGHAAAGKGCLQGDGISLRRSMDMRDVDPHHCVYYGRKVFARTAAEGWLQLAEGGYLPTCIDGELRVWPVEKGTDTCLANRYRAQLRERGRHKGKEEKGSRREASSECESKGQRRTPPRAAHFQEVQERIRRGQRREKDEPGGSRSWSLESESSGQRRTPLREDPAHHADSCGARLKARRSEPLHQGKPRREAGQKGRQGRSPERGSSGQHRWPLRSDSVQEAIWPDGARPQLAIQNQMHSQGRRDNDDMGGHGGRSPEGVSYGQRRMSPQANLIQGGDWQPSTGSKMPAKVRQRRGKCNRWRARASPGGKSRREQESTPEHSAAAAQQGKKQGTIPPWKEKNKKNLKRRINQQRQQRRYKVVDKWAKVRQAQEPDASESAPRLCIEDRANSAQPTETGGRQRSPRPRDACSDAESRSRSKGY